MQKTLPSRELRLALALSKSVRSSASTRLFARWVQSGYNPADVVEEPGIFARRGGIIDIWPPNLPYPVRIDLFSGDEVESLRLFDPATQRTFAKSSKSRLGPAVKRSLKVWPCCTATAWSPTRPPQRRLQPRRQRRRFAPARPTPLSCCARRIAPGSRYLRESQSFHGIRMVLTLFYEQPVSLLDYIPSQMAFSYWMTPSTFLPPFTS